MVVHDHLGDVAKLRQAEPEGGVVQSRSAVEKDDRRPLDQLAVNRFQAGPVDVTYRRTPSPMLIRIRRAYRSSTSGGLSRATIWRIFLHRLARPERLRLERQQELASCAPELRRAPPALPPGSVRSSPHFVRDRTGLPTISSTRS